MLRLNTFGGLVLQQDGQLHTGPASQRRRLALLAVVAAAGHRGAARDKLLALLCPDAAQESARHSFYQALHAIRRSAGSDEIFQGSSTLQLQAIAILERLSRLPTWVSPAELRTDPIWRPLRGYLGFEKLAAGEDSVS